MKIRYKIAGSYIIIIGAILFLSLFTIVKNKQSIDAVQFLRQKISLSKDDMNGVKYDIVQIQQRGIPMGLARRRSIIRMLVNFSIGI